MPVHSQRIFARCDVSTACDTSGDWTSYTPWTGTTIDALTYDPINHVLYGSDATGGKIYRCDTLTSCDTSGDWTISYDTPESTLFALYVDTTNERLYAGSSAGGIIYSCPLSSRCDISTDWSTSFDTPEGRILDFALNETNNVLYAGSYTTGIIYRIDTAGTLGFVTNFSQINAFATDTVNGSEDGALGFSSLVNGTSVQGLYLQGNNVNVGNAGTASTIQIGNTTGAVAQTINIGNNATASSVGTVVLGSTIGASANTIQSGTAGTAVTSTTVSGTGLTVTNASLTTGTGMSVVNNALTTGTGLSVSSTSAALTSGNLVNFSQTATYTGLEASTGNTVNINRSITANNGSASFVQVGTLTNSVGSSLSASRSVSHTVTAQSNQILIVEVSGFFTGASPTSVTFNGVALTQYGSSVTSPSNSATASIWYMINPPVTTANVTVTFAGSNWMNFHATNLYNVNQTTPLTGIQTQSNNSSTTSVGVASGTGDLVMDFLGTSSNQNIVPGAGQTQRHEGSIIGGVHSYGSSEPGAAGTVTMSTSSIVLADNAYIGYNVEAATNPGPTVQGATVNIASNCTVTAGGCYDSSNVVQIAQNYTLATGTVLSVTGAGTGNLLEAIDGSTTVLRVADGGTTTITANGGTNKALIANNGTSTGNILELQDGASPVFTVADGGNVTGVANATTGTAYSLSANSLTTGTGLAVSSTSSALTSGSILGLSHTATYTSSPNVSGNILNLSRAITANDSSTPTVVRDNTTETTAGTYSHTVANQPNRVLIVSVSEGTTTGGPTAGIPTSVTYGGVALTMYTSLVNSATSTSIWYLINPTVQTANVVITPAAGDTFVSSQASTVYNANQTTPLTGLQTSTSGTPSVSVTSGSGDLVFDHFTHRTNAAITTGAGQTQIMYQLNGATMRAKATTEPGAATVTMSATGSATSATYIAYNVEAVTSAGPTLSGAVANISSACSITSGTCYDSASVLNVNQSFVGSTGTVLKVTGAGTGNLLEAIDGSTTVLRVADGGATTLTANGGTNVALSVNNGTSTGNIVNFQDNGTNVATIADGGAITLQNSTDTTSGFRVMDADGGTPVLNVDTTSERIGIGTASPIGELHVSTITSSTTRGLTVAQYSTDTGAASQRFRKARGTEGSPTTVASGDNLGTIAFQGYDGTSYSSKATIQAEVTSAVTTGSVPTDLVFSTGTTSAVSRMRIQSNGDVNFDSDTLFIDSVNNRIGVGWSAPAAKLSVLGNTTGVALRVDNSTSTGSILELLDNGSTVFSVADGGAVTATSTLTVGDSILPNAASTIDIGSATLEFDDIYLGDGNGLRLGLDQDALLAYDETTDDRVELTGTNASLFIEDKLGFGSQTFTMSTAGSATENLTATASYIEITGQDDAADIAQIQTTNAKEGDFVIITNISATTVNIDQNATTKLSGGADVALTQYDVITLIFDGSNWLQISAVTNNS